VLAPSIKDIVCTDEALVNTFLKNGITISYLYRGVDNGALGTISVTLEHCTELRSGPMATAG
jgi:hypothetical protein